MILRDYQIEAVKQGVDYFNSNANYGAIMVLPTGSGKSLIIADIARQLRESMLIFQPTKEILKQNYSKYINYGLEASVFSASLNKKEIGEVTFATIGSVINKLDFFHHFRYIIVDECHLVNAKSGMYQELFKKIGRKNILGLTATPYRLVTDAYGGSMLKFLTRTRPRIFHDVIHVTQNRTLFKNGYLAKLEYEQTRGFDNNQLTLNSTGADYTDGSVKRYYERIEFAERLSNTVRNCIERGRKNILVFTRFIKESESLVDSIGECSQIVSGETPKGERNYIINEFRDGNIRVVSNVGVLTLGFDFPELETIIIARPTRSLALYYQMIGRGIRIHPGKKSTLVVDLCDNYGMFGEVEDLQLVEPRPRLWHISSNGTQLTNIYYDDIMVGKNNGSPDVTLMPFGKYRDQPISEVCKNNKYYVEWLLEQVWLKLSLKLALKRELLKVKAHG